LRGELKWTKNEEIKKEIFELISTPGIEIEDIVEKMNLDYEEVMKILSDEYLKHNLDYGRRMCCRF
jgi:predicted transcriptional regulator